MLVDHMKISDTAPAKKWTKGCVLHWHAVWLDTLKEMISNDSNECIIKI